MHHNIVRVIADHAARNPGALALLAPGRRPLTYARLHAEVKQNARTLNALGIGKEDRIAILLPNGPEMALTFLAVSAIAACAPLNPTCKANELDATLSNLKPKVLIVSPDFDFEKEAVAAKHGIRVVTAAPAFNCEAGVFTLSVLATAKSVSDVLPQSNDVALLLHTSGTTSRPKLVGLTHQHLCRSAENIARALQLSSEDRCLNVMPLFHIHGIVASILASLHAGASVVCSPGFRGRQFFQWLKEFQPTWYTAVPTMHGAIAARAAQHPDIVARHSLRFIRSCSAALPRSILRDLERWFGVPVLEAYGMTEAAHQIACNPLPLATRKPGSVGVATGTDIAIFDEQGRPLGPDCEGEIVVRGGNVISRYVGNPSANGQSFTDDWFRTGDIGSIDRDGYVFIKGRTKELINRGGTKISPLEIENVLLDHPNVADAVAFGLPEWRVGEEVAAAVVLRGPSCAAEIIEFTSRRLSDFKVPRRIVFLEEIPKGPTGKPQRIGLAAKLGLVATPRAEHREDVPKHEARTQLEDLLSLMWTRIIGIERVGLHDNFFEIGGDSLAAVELALGIERVTGRRLTIAALFAAPTIKQLAALIDQDELGFQQCVVPIQGRGTRPPLFCVEAGARYLSLARLLGPDQPVLGVLHASVMAASRATNIEAMAEFCMKTMRAVQPEGPYFVSGWCSDGLVAYEIAQQLRAQGQEVALLVLFDAVNPGRLDKLSATQALFAQADELWRKIWLHLRSLTRLKRDDVPAYFLERSKNVWRTLRKRTWLSRALVRSVLPHGPRNMYEIGKRYRPKPYEGRVVLFRRSLRAVSKYLDAKLGWDGVIAGDFTVIEVQGGHSDMFFEPQVQFTAAKLTRYLERQQQQADHNEADCRRAVIRRSRKSTVRYEVN